MPWLLLVLTEAMLRPNSLLHLLLVLLLVALPKFLLLLEQEEPLQQCLQDRLLRVLTRMALRSMDQMWCLSPSFDLTAVLVSPVDLDLSRCLILLIMTRTTHYSSHNHNHSSHSSSQMSMSLPDLSGIICLERLRLLVVESVLQ